MTRLQMGSSTLLGCAETLTAQHVSLTFPNPLWVLRTMWLVLTHVLEDTLGPNHWKTDSHAFIFFPCFDHMKTMGVRGCSQLKWVGVLCHHVAQGDPPGSWRDSWFTLELAWAGNKPGWYLTTEIPGLIYYGRTVKLLRPIHWSTEPKKGDLTGELKLLFQWQLKFYLSSNILFPMNALAL